MLHYIGYVLHITLSIIVNSIIIGPSSHSRRRRATGRLRAQYDIDTGMISTIMRRRRRIIIIII